MEKYNIYQDPHKRLNLLKMICIELSSQHKVGILQKDFHLENFIYSNNKIFTLDPGQMQFYKNSVPKNKSISNLAMLLLILPSEEIEPKKELCKEYYQSRGWEFQYEDEQQLQKKIKLHRKKVIKQQLKKSLRTSKRFLQIEISHFSGIFSKSFCIETEAIDFINRIDILMTKGHILKNGNTSFVSHITWNNKDIVIKRYNHKNFFHSLRHTIINSRAKRNWLHAQKLTMLGIPTPKPLAFIEKRKGPILWNSYYITEYIKGPNLHVFLNDKSISENQHISTINQVEKIFNKMSDFLITHGDLKHTNILISEKGPILTDLDSMKSHKLNMFYKIRRKKDIKRFQKDGLNLYQ